MIATLVKPDGCSFCFHPYDLNLALGIVQVKIGWLCLLQKCMRAESDLLGYVR